MQALQISLGLLQRYSRKLTEKEMKEEGGTGNPQSLTFRVCKSNPMEVRLVQNTP